MIEIEKPNIATVNLSEDGKSGKFTLDSDKDVSIIIK